MSSHTNSAYIARQKRLAMIKAMLKDGRDSKPIEQAEDRSRFPLSTGQQRLWFLEQAMPGSLVYQVPAVVHLEGPLDPSALETSVRQLVQRHEVLRARVRVADGVPVSEILADIEFGLDLREITDADPERAWRQALAVLADYVRTPFDLETGPLFRVMLLELRPEQHLLAFVFHHIICEAWSIAILFKELERLYAQQIGGGNANLPSPRIQFGDFSRWERDNLETGPVRDSVDYWREKLRDVPALELLTDRRRPATQTQNGAMLGRALSKALVRNVEAFAREHNVTPFIVTLSSLFVLLYRYTRQRTITVGSPVSNRTREELQELVGFFVNTLVFRADLADDTSFLELIEQVKTTVLEGFSHQAAPFELIVDELQVVRDLSRNPLFQVMFAFQNTPMPKLELSGLRSSRVLRNDEIHSSTSKVDLSVVIELADGAWTLWAEYNTDLFDAQSIEGLLNHYEVLLANLVAGPATRLAFAPLLTAAERQKVVVAWNQTASKYPRDRCIHELFEEQARATPDSVALMFGDAQLTYRDLDARAEQLALRLRRFDVGPGVLVGICAERSFEMVVGLLAILKAGGAYVPLDSGYPQERLAFMIEDTRVPVLLVQEALVGRLPEHGARVLLLDADQTPPAESHPQEPSVGPSPDDLAYVMYTSGSTGRPKGVCVRHRSVVRLVRDTNYIQLDPQRVFLQLAPISFDAATLEIWAPLLNGGRLAIMPPGNPSLAGLEEAIERYGVTTLWLTAGFFHVIVDERLSALRSVRELLAGGDVLSVPHVERLLRELPDCRVINGYGPTENTTFSCCKRIAPASRFRGSVPIGRPIANTRVYVLDPHRQPVPIGVPGELYVGGDGVALGYLRRPELTAERFLPDPFDATPGAQFYRTGDLVRYLPDGDIEFLGRLDDQVKIRGFRVEPGEIESILSRDDTIRECAVVVREDARTAQKMLVAYFVSSSDEEPLSINNLRKALAAKLPQYMIPQVFMQLPTLPKTQNGKVDRSALPDPVSPSESRAEEQTPVTELEALLAEIWSNVLGVESVSANDNFFDLGGNSLLAVRVVHRLREQRGVRVNPLVLFSGSLRQTAEAIEEIMPPSETVPGGFSLRRIVASVTQNINRLVNSRQ